MVKPRFFFLLAINVALWTGKRTCSQLTPQTSKPYFNKMKSRPLIEVAPPLAVNERELALAHHYERCYNAIAVPEVGIEPTRISPREFESRASASSATPAGYLRPPLLLT